MSALSVDQRLEQLAALATRAVELGLEAHYALEHPAPPIGELGLLACSRSVCRESRQTVRALESVREHLRRRTSGDLS